MSVFDINPGSTSSATQATGTTGSVVHQSLHQEGNSTGLNTNSLPAEQDTGKEKKIILDGPLSEIYTKALNMVYSNKAEQVVDSVSQETQQMDAVLVADIHALSKDKKEDEIKDAQNAAYVYVTNDRSLSDSGLIDTFDNIRVALDSQQFNSKVVCIESTGMINSDRIEILTDMAKKFGAKVFYTRSATMNHLNGLYHE